MLSVVFPNHFAQKNYRPIITRSKRDGNPVALVSVQTNGGCAGLVGTALPKKRPRSSWWLQNRIIQSAPVASDPFAVAALRNGFRQVVAEGVCFNRNNFQDKHRLFALGNVRSQPGRRSGASPEWVVKKTFSL
jgi:hypothetical protein